MAEDKQHATLSHLCLWVCKRDSQVRSTEQRNKQKLPAIKEKALAQFNMWNNSSGFSGIYEEKFRHHAAKSAIWSSY